MKKILSAGFLVLVFSSFAASGSRKDKVASDLAREICHLFFQTKNFISNYGDADQSVVMLMHNLQRDFPSLLGGDARRELEETYNEGLVPAEYHLLLEEISVSRKIVKSMLETYRLLGETEGISPIKVSKPRVIIPVDPFKHFGF